MRLIDKAANAPHYLIEISEHDDPQLPAQEGVTKPTVLLIEGNESDRKAMSRMLHDTCNIYTTNNGRDGLEIARRHGPDCILLNHHLPDTSGMGMINQLITHDPNIAIIMLTEASDETVAAKAMRNGAYYYIAKDNINADILQQFIYNALQFSQTRRKRDSQTLLLENSALMLAHGVFEPLQMIREYLRLMQEDKENNFSPPSAQRLHALEETAGRLNRTLAQLTQLWKS